MHSRSHHSYLNFISWFFSNKSEYVFKKEPWQKNAFANLIADASILEDSSQNHGDYTIDLEMLEFDPKDYNEENDYFEPIFKIYDYSNKYLKDYLVDFLIHGSMSTLDYSKGWSDIDTLLIIKKDILKKPLLIMELRSHILKIIPEIYKIDPLQHHEFIITTEKSITNPRYILLPSQTLSLSKSLFNNKLLTIAKERNIESGKRNIQSINKLFKKSYEEGYMDHHKLNNVALEEKFKNLNCMYQLKYFLGCIMILPTYYFDAINESCYKKFSFGFFESIREVDSEILKKASKIRELWPVKEKFPYKGNKIPNWICEILGDNYFEKAFIFSSEISKLIK